MWLWFLMRVGMAMFGAPSHVGMAQPEPILLPVEVLGEDGTTVNRILHLSREQAGSAREMWLRVHGLRYPEQASLQINQGAWIPLRNDRVKVAEPGKSFGGIGGGFATLELSVKLPADEVVAGDNMVRFRFNHTDGLASGYRVLGLNFLRNDGAEILPEAAFVEDAPETWSPPLPDEASIQAGKDLWFSAPLVASSLPHSPPIQARCTDCHARDGRDLKYFNFSNVSIITRSRFHGLSIEQGEKIASYIRSLTVPSPGRPWNPPYQPGPGLDQRPVSDWASGAGIKWVLDDDVKALPYLIDQHEPLVHPVDSQPIDWGFDSSALATRIGADIFRPDGDLNAREIPIAMQLPDWSQWLPRVHPKDAWGQSFTKSEFATMYDGAANGENGGRHRVPLRSLLKSIQTSDVSARSVLPAFTRWSLARRTFLSHFVRANGVWTPAITEKVYSTQLWQLMKTWEMTQEFGLEDRGRNLIGSQTEARVWCNTIPADTAPAAVHIPNGPAGVGGGALTNEYLSASWYELQIILNSGNHRHRDRTPVDWVYLVSEFHDLYIQSHQPEPVRLLVAVTKSLQSSDPRLGPDDFSQGWRPDQDVDPRIMISSIWKPVFEPLPVAVRRALTESLLSAWMDKNLQYPIALYLPLPSFQHDYRPHGSYADISGGRTWRAAEQFRAAGVSDDLVDRLRDWGIAYTDRAARLQYQ
jgi:hypothetical protein